MRYSVQLVNPFVFSVLRFKLLTSFRAVCCVALRGTEL